IPLYIADDSEGMEFGPLQMHPEKAAPYAEIVQAGAGTHAANGQLQHAATMPASTEEPIAKAVRDGIKSFAHWWNYGPLNTPLKIIILIAAAVFASLNGAWLMASAIALGSVYLVYLGI